MMTSTREHIHGAERETHLIEILHEMLNPTQKVGQLTVFKKVFIGMLCKNCHNERDSLRHLLHKKTAAFEPDETFGITLDNYLPFL